MHDLAGNLRRLRKRAGLTQAALADAAGLPRATCASLEQPGANPGLDTLMTVAAALEVSLDELVNPMPEARYFKVLPEQMADYRAEGGRFSARTVSPIASKGVQINHVTIQPATRSVGRPHPRGAQEFYFALAGTTVLSIADERVTVEPGCLVQFPGHHKHVYENPGRTPVEAISVVVLHLG
jgi:mannose-6-phosphate isomerase-like protein (cupin superfamily)